MHHAARTGRCASCWPGGGVEQTPRGGYRPGLRLFTLGQQAPRQREPRWRALRYLDDLYEANHENVYLAAEYLEKLTGHRSTPRRHGCAAGHTFHWLRSREQVTGLLVAGR